MKIYNIGFKNHWGEDDETQIDIEKSNWEQETIDLVNIILELKDEMDIMEVVYIDETKEEN